MSNIKTWKERLSESKLMFVKEDAMQFEIIDLRAALATAQSACDNNASMATDYYKQLRDNFALGQTVDGKVKELQGYMYNGKPCYEVRPIYTWPAPAKPLTEQQIEDMHGEANRGYNIERDDYFKACRDAEAAHGIKEAP